MNTGHDGLLSTIHASSTEGALRRIAALAVRAAGQMTIREAEEEGRTSIDFVVQLKRQSGRRSISVLLEVQLSRSEESHG
jgi:Flp pilus assembly CpaF family ATPase